jgi:hypothetical protein
MKKLLLVATLLISVSITAQRVKGTILDLETNRPIDDVHIQIGKDIVVTNKKGKFSFKAPKNWDRTLFLSHVSYQEKEIPYEKDERLTIYLAKKRINLQEVFVVGNKGENTLKFTELPDMPRKLHSFASVTRDDKLYVFGGDRSFEVDTNRKALSETAESGLTDFGTGAISPMDFFFRRAILYTPYFDHSEDIYSYDFNTKRWSKEEIELRKRSNHSATIIGNKAYILGGKRMSKNRRNIYLDEKVEVFDLDAKTLKVDDVNPHRAVGLETFAYKDRMIALGGSIKEKRNGKVIFTQKVHSYNPKTGLWYELAKIPIRGEVSTCLVGDRLYFFNSEENKESSSITSVDLVTGRFRKEGQLLYKFEKPAVAKKDKTIFLFENRKLLSYNTETKELKSYLIDLGLLASKSYFFNDSLYILGGFSKVDFELRPSRKFYKIDLSTFKKTRARKYVKL